MTRRVPTSGDLDHPFFARLYRRIGPGAERQGVAEHRRELLGGLRGRVVEPGAGMGLSFPHYPPEVEEVVAVEPESSLRADAERAARDAPVKVTVTGGRAEALPLEDDSVDAVIFALVLCSVEDQAAALAEARRVLRPGGEMRFYEHVAADGGALEVVQRVADATLWPRIAGGCHTHRDTLGAIEAAGFVPEDVRRLIFPGPWAPVAPHVLGRARPA